MAQEQFRVLQPPEHLEIVRNVTGADQYGEFYSRFFKGGDYWTKRLTGDLPSDTPPAYFNLAALAGDLALQQGFSSLESQEQRHQGKNWKKPLEHPYHLLAVIRYLAALQLKNHPIRSEIAQELRKSFDPMTALAVWGVDLGVKGGQPLYGINEKNLIIRGAREKVTSGATIFLPSTDLNQNLAAIEFDGEIADTISDSEFDTKFLPLFQEVLKDIVDPKPPTQAFRNNPIIQ